MHIANKVIGRKYFLVFSAQKKELKFVLVNQNNNHNNNNINKKLALGAKWIK